MSILSIPLVTVVEFAFNAHGIGVSDSTTTEIVGFIRCVDKHEVRDDRKVADSPPAFGVPYMIASGVPRTAKCFAGLIYKLDSTPK